jgi:excisionase family DNA binding protein
MQDIGTFETVLRQLVREAVRQELAQFAADRGPMRNADDIYLSVASAARVAAVAPGTIRAWIRAGRLTSKRAGRVLRVSRIELERFMGIDRAATPATDIRERAARRIESDRAALRKHAA